MTFANESGTGNRKSRNVRVSVISMIAVVGIVAAGALGGLFGTARAATPIDLGTADSFAVLAGSEITNTGPTTITGDVGLHPGTAVSGFGSVTLHGQMHIDNDTALQAKNDLTTAYTNAANQVPSATLGPELGGETLPGGVYNSTNGTFEITGSLTLDADFVPETVWIFQADSSLITAPNSSVVLINGADACNVFWQVGSSATLDTGTTFVGNILALTSITLNSSATINGRALARNGAVTMNTNTITRADCTTPNGTPTPTPTPSEGPTPTPSEGPTPTPSEGPTPSDSPSPSNRVESTPTPTNSPNPTPTASPTPTAEGGGQVLSGPPVAPPTSDTPQITEVPGGSVPAGDGSMAMDDGTTPAAAAILLLPLSVLALYATWRHQKA